jgi:hypothetical protein
MLTTQKQAIPSGSVPDTDGEPSPILVRLLDEIERAEEQRPAPPPPRPARQSSIRPRPFAYD